MKTITESPQDMLEQKINWAVPPGWRTLLAKWCRLEERDQIVEVADTDPKPDTYEP